MVSNERKGIALFLILGLTAVFVPVLLYLSQTGSSQVRLAMKYHEVHQSEAAAIAGNNSGLSRLRGNLSGLQQLTNLLIGEIAYDLTIQPTGTGLLNQELYHLFSKCAKGQHTFILMSDAEQMYPDPDPPVTVIPHDTWNTIEPYDINLAADVTSMENLRGQDILSYEATKNYEKSVSKAAYSSELMSKRGKLPTELQTGWADIVAVLEKEKITF